MVYLTKTIVPLLFTIFQLQLGISQCTSTEIESMNSTLKSNQQTIDHILKDQYNNDWFDLIEHINNMDSESIKSIAAYRNALVPLLTCMVTDEVLSKEEALRSKLRYDDYSIAHLKQGFAGSEGLSSDIDVNLKGDGTEFAVEEINAAFKKLYGSEKEIGEIFDINFYAKDFVPVLNSDQKIKKNGQQFYEKDDWREHIILDEEIKKRDVYFQNLMAHVFMRKNMSEKDYEALMNSSKGIPQRLRFEVEDKYFEYQSQLDEYRKDANSKMCAENRMYEEMLNKAAIKRVEYLRNKKNNSTYTDASYLDWKMAKTYSTLNANEAHCTAGAIVHVVANKQMLEDLFKKKRVTKRKLKLTADELYQSFTEQIGFAFHKIDHSKNAQEFVNVGKYIHRAYNALKHFYGATGLDPIYTEKERLAATNWEGVKKGRKRNSDGKFALDVIDKVDELRSVLLDFDKAYQRYGIGSSIGKLEDLPTLKSNLKALLIHLKTVVDYQYFFNLSK